MKSECIRFDQCQFKEFIAALDRLSAALGGKTLSPEDAAKVKEATAGLKTSADNLTASENLQP